MSYSQVISGHVFESSSVRGPCSCQAVKEKLKLRYAKDIEHEWLSLFSVGWCAVCAELENNAQSYLPGHAVDINLREHNPKEFQGSLGVEW